MLTAFKQPKINKINRNSEKRSGAVGLNLGRIDFGEALDDFEDSVDYLLPVEMIVAVRRH